MGSAHYTITSQVDQDLEDWIRTQPDSRNALVIRALNLMRNVPSQPTLGNFQVDPYGAAVTMIRQALVNARENMGGMSEGEWQILRLIRNVLLEEDPAVMPRNGLDDVFLHLGPDGLEVSPSATRI
jgi:hypothetical protein